MQPTISIPKHWDYPRFALDQRTKDGVILGLYYYPNGTELAEQFGDGWRYALMPNKNSDQLFHFQESQIQPLTPEELLSEITEEIEFYQQPEIESEAKKPSLALLLRYSEAFDIPLSSILFLAEHIDEGIDETTEFISPKIIALLKFIQQWRSP